MRRSSILLATIANNAGISVQKAEKLLLAYREEVWRDSDNGRDFASSLGRIAGLRDALVMLGADGEMVRNWLHAKDDEICDTSAHD